MKVQLGTLARAIVGSAVLTVLLAIASCGDSGTTDAPSGSSGTSGGPTADSGEGGSSSGNPADSSTTTDSTADVATGPFTLTSSAYMNGKTIPTKHECSSNGPGMNVSPPLAWSDAPAGTQSYAIVMRDLDFQNGFIHWVIWDIPASSLALPENVEHAATPAAPAGAKQANFNGSIIGYQGPCSPGGVNTYEITLYAIPTATVAGITPATAKAAAAAAIVGAATATAKLAGES